MRFWTRLIVGGVMAVAMFVAAGAAETPASPAPPPNDPAVQASMPGCAVWTDRCVTCQRDAGKIVCSNIGIACQPQKVECLRVEPAEEKKDRN
jgi:hypothetical protein